MTMIVCIGNRYVANDAAGPAVYDRLAARAPVDGVALVDGGIAGLNLLRLIDGEKRVVFVDSVSGFGEPGNVVTIDPSDIDSCDAAYDHGAGLAFLLQAAPVVCDCPPSGFVIVGIEQPANTEAIEEAATRAVTLATDGGAR